MNTDYKLYGMKLCNCTQSEYNGITNKAINTLYIVSPDDYSPTWTTTDGPDYKMKFYLGAQDVSTAGIVDFNVEVNSTFDVWDLPSGSGIYRIIGIPSYFQVSQKGVTTDITINGVNSIIIKRYGDYIALLTYGSNLSGAYIGFTESGAEHSQDYWIKIDSLVSAEHTQNKMTSDTVSSTDAASTVKYPSMYTVAQYVATKISALGTVMRYKGSVAVVANLPTSGNTAGDVWNVTATDDNYAWNGTSWDKLASTIDISGKEDKSNKLTAMPTSPTDTQYLSAKAIKSAIAAGVTDLESTSNKTNVLSAQSTTTQYPNAKIVWDTILAHSGGEASGIQKLTGTSSSPIIFADTDTSAHTGGVASGIYTIEGAYKYFSEDESSFEMSSPGILLINNDHPSATIAVNSSVPAVQCYIIEPATMEINDTIEIMLNKSSIKNIVINLNKNMLGAVSYSASVSYIGNTPNKSLWTGSLSNNSSIKTIYPTAFPEDLLKYSTFDLRIGIANNTNICDEHIIVTKAPDGAGIYKYRLKDTKPVIIGTDVSLVVFTGGLQSDGGFVLASLDDKNIDGTAGASVFEIREITGIS